MKSSLFPALLALPAFLACASPPTATGAPTEPPAAGDQAAPAADGTLPTPYTAEAIRAGCAPGTQVVFAITAAGQPTVHRVMRFREDDGHSATLETWMETAEGQPIGDHATQVAAWSELRDHARFPAGSTRVRSRIQVPFGNFEGWHYAVPVDASEGGGIRHFWFADRFPGPPLRYLEVAGGETRSEMEMIARAQP